MKLKDSQLRLSLKETPDLTVGDRMAAETTKLGDARFSFLFQIQNVLLVSVLHGVWFHLLNHQQPLSGVCT